MLSGDKQAVVDQEGFKDAGNRIAFVGDGVNDAPVVALAALLTSGKP